MTHSSSRILVLTIAALFACTVVANVGSRPRSADAAAPTPAYEIFTGSVGDFYVVPDHLPAGAPGELIRVQTVATTTATTTMRIMYHSTDGAGRDRAVTGTVSFPNAPAPAEGWPVLSIANGTVGLGSQCAPSRSSTSVYDFGIGGVAVASDYIGSGPVGEVQAYMSRPSEGHSVLDAVRAARNLDDAHAGSRVLVLGGSQGGHGALSANELATDYSPELHLLGTVALAPAAMFDRTYGPLDEIVTRVVTAMGLVGLSTEHPDVDLSAYAGPAGLAALQTIRTQCTDAIIPTVLQVPGGIFTNDPRTTEPARSIMLVNDVGHVAAPSPVLLVQGTADSTVDPRRTDDLFDRMCGAGQVTDYLTVPGADHGNVTQMAMDEIRSWLADRLDGRAASTSCAEPPATTTPAPSTSTPATTAPSTTSSVASTTVPATTEPSTTLDGNAAVTTTSTPASTRAVAASRGDGDRSGSSRSADAAPRELPATGAPLGPLGAAALGAVLAGLAVTAGARSAVSRR